MTPRRIFLRKVRIRFLPVYPLFLWLLYSAKMTEQRLRFGIILIALGELLRVWADGYVGHVKVNWTQKWRGDPKIGSLVTGGPYAFVRHPLYLGTFLIGAGFCVIGGNLWASLGALAFFLTVYRRKMVKEEALILDELGAPYLAYQAAVPRWIPTLRRYFARQGQWSWQGIAASKEWKTVIWITVLLIVFYFREEFLQEREFLSQKHQVKDLILMGLLVLLVAVDVTYELARRWKRRPDTSGSASNGQR